MEHGLSGYIEPMTRRSRVNAARVQAVIHAISDRFTAEPFPSMSDHFKEDADGNYYPSPIVVQDASFGYDSDGNFHCHSLDPTFTVDL